MKQLGIRSITIRKFKNYRNKQNEHSELKNLVNQNFSAQKPNQIWLSDITYIHTIKHGWTYLASVLDVCTRKIVGYSYGRKMDRSLVISALTNSWQNQNYPNNVILHSDRGSQYTSSEYIAAAERMGFRLSYSKKGCPFDNAPMESFHSVFEKRKKSTSNTILLSMRLISDPLIILMAFIILIAFTRLLIICRPFILKNLYFNLFSFRLFVSCLLTMVQIILTFFHFAHRLPLLLYRLFQTDFLLWLQLFL